MKMNMMRNGPDEDYDVNSVMDSGSDEWHAITDTELKEEFTLSAATKHRRDQLSSPEQSNSRLIQGDLSVHTQIRRENRKRMDWLLVM